MTIIQKLESRLKQAIKKHGIPGASVAVLRGRRVISDVSAGVVNLNTRIAATPDTLFQIGSITKTMTATMILQLRDEGRLSLDDRLLKYLPNFRNADMQRLRKVTIQHLLCHQSGIDGDFFPPMDSGDQSIDALLKMSSMLPSLFEPGTNYSYCNVGFSCLGRVIEILDNRSFDESLKLRIFDALGMQHAISRPEDNLRFLAAVGHLPDPADPKRLVVPEYPYLSIGHRAAGATPAMTASDLLKFAGAHLNQGTALNGETLLKKGTASEMLKPQLKQSGVNSFGLAWALDSWSGKKILTHSGGTLGQFSLLVLCPSEKLAVAALVNGGNAGGFFQDIVGGILKHSAKIDMPGLPEENKKARVIAGELIGQYANMNSTIEITEDNGDLLVSSSVPYFSSADKKVKLRFTGPRIATTPVSALEFGGPKGEPAQWLRAGGRLFPRHCW
jgi:CubicO group peptidase (beta-lactamase class C family)